MNNQASSFFSTSKSIVSEFLNTAVVLDDRAYIPKAASGIVDQPTQEPSKSVRGGGSLNVPTSSQSDSAHALNPSEIVSSFAEKGIICSVIQPPEEISLREKLGNVVMSADITILDWDLYGDSGESVQDLIRSVIQTIQKQSPAQLRLFVIYTGEPTLGRIFDILVEMIKEYGVTPILDEDRLVINFEAVRIAIFSKPGSNSDEQPGQVVEFDELVEVVIDEFTAMIAGLVSNFALHAFAELRKNVFRVLTRFSKDLDGPYLTHRMLQHIPEDAEELLINLLTEEVQALWEEKKINEIVNYERITEWCKTKEHLGEIELFPDKVISRDEFLSFVENGITYLANNTLFSGGEKKRIHKNITQNIAPSMDQLDARFAELTNMRSYYDTLSPSLSLGTILKIKDTDKYLLCLMPKCDSVRLDELAEPRSFPLLELEQNPEKFSIVVRQESLNDRYLKLLPRIKPYDLRLTPFDVEENGGKDRIIAQLVDDRLTFRSSEGQLYVWIGELKSEHALRILQQLANNFTRVGLNESEWLRRSAK